MTRFASVVFDCDSTLSAVEGVEELAAGHRPEVEALTEAAMRGAVPLEEVYGRRLELIRPSRASVHALASRYIEALVEDAADTVTALRAARVDVRIVSGGLLPAIAELARHLGLPEHAVAAVPVRFDDGGEFAGYDEQAPVARAGGKADVVRAWLEGRSGADPEAAPALPRPVLFVGDGATDLEAMDSVDLFVAYAGVVARPNVVSAAPVVIQCRSLAPVLVLALGEDAPEDGAGRALYLKGQALIGDGAVEWK